MTRYYTSDGTAIEFGFGGFRWIDWIVFVACLPLMFPGLLLWSLLVLWWKYWFVWRPGALRRTKF